VSADSILLIRHGTTDHSAAGLFTGRADPSLNQEGRDQAGRWRQLIESLQDARFFQSPLARAVQTANLAGMTAVATSSEFAEWDLGSLDGLPADRFRAEHPGWNLFVDGPPDGTGESTVDVQRRASRAVELAGAPGGISVVVTHGQFIRVMAAVLLDSPLVLGSTMSCGPGRAALFTRRASGAYSLTGWNTTAPPSPTGFFKDLT
jgi:probable phosphoglycerate mutase